MSNQDVNETGEINIINKVCAERDALQGRVIELESALKWWLNERMKGFSEDQYGKRNLRKILNEGSLPVYGETK